jgi:hypothetical protein
MRSAREDITAARAEIKDINLGITARLLNLEANSVSKIELDPLQAEIDSLKIEVENLKLWRSMLIGAWGVCTIILIPVAFAYFT